MHPPSFVGSQWVLIAVELLICILVDLCIYVPVLFRIFTTAFQFAHQRVTSDIPGNPHAFHTAVISFFRTLPEPNNTNVIWTNFQLTGTGGYIVRGRAPFARCNSLTVYCKNSADPPASLDLSPFIDKETRYFEVIIASSQEYKSLLVDGIVDPQMPCLLIDRQWSKGYLAMRNYLVCPGTIVTTPEIVYANRSNQVYRYSDTIVTGPAALSLQLSPGMRATWRLAAFNTAVGIVNYFLLDPKVYHVTYVVISIGLLCALLLEALMYAGGTRKLHAMWLQWSHGQTNKLFRASTEQGSTASQPCTLHTYWFMKWQVDQYTDVSIRGRIRPKGQAYWSFVPYSLHGIPLPVYVYDQNAHHIYPHTKCTADEGGDHEYEFHIRLTMSPSSQIVGKNTGQGKDSSEVLVNEIDVSRYPSGYGFFRLVHPVDENVIDFSTPIVTVEHRSR